MTKKIQFEKEEWELVLGDLLVVRELIAQSARPHELRDLECSLAKNVLKRDSLMEKIRLMLEPEVKN